jgi:DNA-binding beta-propeller fold protein YncE
LRQFGKTGKDDGEVNYPNSIYIDSDSIVFVTEIRNHRISLFTLGGEFLISFGSKGAGPGQFSRPCGIIVDRQEIIYIADFDNHRIQIFAQLTH